MFRLIQFLENKNVAIINDTDAKNTVRINVSSQEDAEKEVLRLNKNALKRYLERYRYNREVEGITFDNKKFPTDRESVVLIKNIQSELEKEVVEKADFKLSSDNWYKLDKYNSKQLVSNIVKHIQSCFESEKKVENQINSMKVGDTMMKKEIRKLFDRNYEKTNR